MRERFQPRIWMQTSPLRSPQCMRLPHQLTAAQERRRTTAAISLTHAMRRAAAARVRFCGISRDSLCLPDAAHDVVPHCHSSRG
jgi:hypothetical protein